MTAKDLDEIEAQMNKTSPYYLPALLAMARASQWRPIETAPKDGSVMLVWIPADSHDDRPEIASVHWEPRKQGWLCANSGWMLESPQPTAWMPLPLPPATAQRGPA